MAAPSFLERLHDKSQRKLRRRRLMAELEACPPNEVRRMAQDLGPGESDPESLDSNHPGPSEFMPLRLQQLGLDPAFIKCAGTATYRDMERVCATCKAWRRCARDLEKGNVQVGMGSYCLNTVTIDALTLDRLYLLSLLSA
jgi:hypothetical protein